MQIGAFIAEPRPDFCRFHGADAAEEKPRRPEESGKKVSYKCQSVRAISGHLPARNGHHYPSEKLKLGARLLGIPAKKRKNRVQILRASLVGLRRAFVATLCRQTVENERLIAPVKFSYEPVRSVCRKRALVVCLLRKKASPKTFFVLTNGLIRNFIFIKLYL